MTNPEPERGMREHLTDLDALDALDKAATHGPWRIERQPSRTNVRAGGQCLHSDEQFYPTPFDPEDTALIVALRNAPPAILQALRQYRRNDPNHPDFEMGI